MARDVGLDALARLAAKVAVPNVNIRGAERCRFHTAQDCPYFQFRKGVPAEPVAARCALRRRLLGLPPCDSFPSLRLPLGVGVDYRLHFSVSGHGLKGLGGLIEPVAASYEVVKGERVLTGGQEVQSLVEVVGQP